MRRYAGVLVLSGHVDITVKMPIGARIKVRRLRGCREVEGLMQTKVVHEGGREEELRYDG